MLKQRHSGDISLLYDKLTAEAKHLAHSYTNSVVALRASLAQAKPLDTEIRLNTIIHDLTAYTLKLSKDLVVSSFANANIDGFAIAPEVIRPTYLRGTLLQAMGQYREKFKALTIEVSAAFAQEEPFINFGYTTLASVASNLLSNAADAQASDVAIVVSRENEYAVIQFLDNGTGISGDPSRVFTGWTTKGEGHGKGLQGCKAQVKKEGGDLVCRGSQPEQTVFELRARLQPTPVWFIDKVRLKSKSVVVVVDDEPGVDELWQRAFEAGFQNTNLPEDALPRFIKLNSPDDLISNARNALKEGTVFLVDYQFGEGSTRNGIQLIEELDLRDRAILVTGHSDEQPVINEVIKKGLKLLSKTYMYSVGFSIEMGGDNETDSNTWYLSYARLRLAA